MYTHSTFTTTLQLYVCPFTNVRITTKISSAVKIACLQSYLSTNSLERFAMSCFLTKTTLAITSDSICLKLSKLASCECRQAYLHIG